MSYDKMSLGTAESDLSNLFLDLGLPPRASYPFPCIVKPQEGLGSRERYRGAIY